MNPDSSHDDALLSPTEEVMRAAESLGASSGHKRGEVFTRREVVEFILDLVGYTSDLPLFDKRVLEPSFGDGDFLIPIVQRLLHAYARRRSASPNSVEFLGDCIRAVEVNDESFRRTRNRLANALFECGLPKSESSALLDKWLVQGDFLLQELSFSFDYVVGNPPYLRHELIPDALKSEYRRRFNTIYGRADLYVPFIERSLLALAPSGVLGFICANRWTKNQYGGPLRKLIAEQFHLKYYVDMSEAPAFLSEVSAYPSVAVIANEKPGSTRFLSQSLTDISGMAGLARSLQSRSHNEQVFESCQIASGAEPWILESLDRIQFVRRIESEFPQIEQAGCKVGIGVATGADAVFISKSEDLDVEEDRKLPLLRTKDISSGSVKWQGYWVVNPFDESGKPINLGDYPRLSKYLERHREVLLRRHVARNNPPTWYRTIDRIYPELASTPKLLIPDIKNCARIVYEGGRYYPTIICTT